MLMEKIASAGLKANQAKAPSSTKRLTRRRRILSSTQARTAETASICKSP